MSGREEMYYYLDDANNPMGPVSIETLTEMYDVGDIKLTTKVAREGDNSWVPVNTVLQIPVNPSLPPLSSISETVSDPVYRDIIKTMALTVITFGLYYIFYLIPSYTRDLESITKKRRQSFTQACVLGGITIGLYSLGLSIFYAFELQKYGEEKQTVGKRDSLGWLIAGIQIGSFVIAFFSGGAAFAISWGLGLWAVYELQKEINLYTPEKQNTNVS